MKKTIIGTLLLVMVLSAGVTIAFDTTGNGAPKAKLLGLVNIIGVKDAKNEAMDGNGGSVIFVNLTGKSKINLQQGDDFAVLDKNGTDGGGALLQLPDPGLDPYVVGDDMTGVDTLSDYSVFVRPLGKPGGFATITTCADVVESALKGFLSKQDIKVLNDSAELGGVASVENVGQDITLRKKGKSTFTNVTAELLTIVLKVAVDEDGDGTDDYTIYVRVPIFDDILANEYWEYDNDKLKLLQVRFYDVETDVSAGDDDLPAL